MALLLAEWGLFTDACNISMGNVVSEGGLKVYHCPIGHSLRALHRDILRFSGGKHPAGASPSPTPTPVLGASAIPPGPPPGIVISRRSAAMVGDDFVLAHIRSTRWLFELALPAGLAGAAASCLLFLVLALLVYPLWKGWL